MNLEADERFFEGMFLKAAEEEEHTLVVMFGCFALVMTCLAWSLLLKPHIHPKLTLVQEGNVIRNICQEMDSNSLDESTQVDEICLVCLTEKLMHLEHCKKCNKCIRHFHVHSSFFNTCFGDSNIRPYLLFQFLSLVLCCIYIHLIGRFNWLEASSEFFVGKLMQTYWNMSFTTLIVFIALQYYTLHFLEKCLKTVSALSRGMTLNEFSNPELYKYLYSPVSVKKRFDE